MNALHRSSEPSAHLLRTLAAVPVSSTVLDLACGAGRHTEALLRLGFPVHACDPRPEAVAKTRARVRELIDEETARSCVQERPLERLDALEETFDWVVADRAEVLLHSEADLNTLLKESHRLLELGGWLYLAVPASRADASGASGETVRFSTSDLEAVHQDVDLATSRPPTRVEEDDVPRIRVLFRCVDR